MQLIKLFLNWENKDLRVGP